MSLFILIYESAELGTTGRGFRFTFLKYLLVLPVVQAKTAVLVDPGQSAAAGILFFSYAAFLESIRGF